MIKVEIKRHDPDEETEETFENLQDATEWLCKHGRGARIWVNGSPATLQGCTLHIESAKPLPAADLMSRAQSQFDALFGRPAPTNPATYAAKGEEL